MAVNFYRIKAAEGATLAASEETILALADRLEQVAAGNAEAISHKTRARVDMFETWLINYMRDPAHDTPETTAIRDEFYNFLDDFNRLSRADPVVDPTNVRYKNMRIETTALNDDIPLVPDFVIDGCRYMGWMKPHRSQVDGHSYTMVTDHVLGAASGTFRTRFEQVVNDHNAQANLRRHLYVPGRLCVVDSSDTQFGVTHLLYSGELQAVDQAVIDAARTEVERITAAIQTIDATVADVVPCRDLCGRPRHSFQFRIRGDADEVLSVIDDFENYRTGGLLATQGHYRQSLRPL
ncbi:MAG: hypothetical protein ACE5FT_03850 [Candidatus Nanoarchaeia archaeon]